MDGTTYEAMESHAPCSKCGQPLVLGERSLLGEVVSCNRCHAQLEVVEVEPVRLGPLAKIEEDEEDFERTS